MCESSVYLVGMSLLPRPVIIQFMYTASLISDMATETKSLRLPAGFFPVLRVELLVTVVKFQWTGRTGELYWSWGFWELSSSLTSKAGLTETAQTSVQISITHDGVTWKVNTINKEKGKKNTLCFVLLCFGVKTWQASIIWALLFITRRRLCLYLRAGLWKQLTLSCTEQPLQL